MEGSGQRKRKMRHDRPRFIWTILRCSTIRWWKDFEQLGQRFAREHSLSWGKSVGGSNHHRRRGRVQGGVVLAGSSLRANEYGVRGKCDAASDQEEHCCVETIWAMVFGGGRRGPNSRGGEVGLATPPSPDTDPSGPSMCAIGCVRTYPSTVAAESPVHSRSRLITTNANRRCKHGTAHWTIDEFGKSPSTSVEVHVLCVADGKRLSLRYGGCHAAMMCLSRSSSGCAVGHALCANK